MGRPISYEMQMMFVGSPGAFEEAMNTGSGIARLDFIQAYDFSFNIERAPLKQIGSDSFATRQTQLAPDVNLNIEYYLNDGWNEKYLGLDIDQYVLSNPFETILSSTGDRNFYISIAKNDGIDQNLQGEVVNSNILSIGNAYITNYEINIAVNQLATVSCSFVGTNANVQDYETSKYLPSVNAIVSGQNAQDANKKFALSFAKNDRNQAYIPKATQIFNGGCPYSKCKITPDFQSGGGTSPITFGFFDAIANNFQSMQFSVQFERKSLYGFGNNHPFTRKIQKPIIATLGLSALIDDFEAENLSKVFHSEGGLQKSMLIEFFNLSGSKKFALSLKNLTLESYSLGARIGDRVLVETSWTVEVNSGAGSNVEMEGSYRNGVLDTTLVNESFSVSELFSDINGSRYVSYGIDKNGYLWSWGQDNLFESGVSTGTVKNTKATPKRIFQVSNANRLSMAVGSNFYLDKSGKAWGWGYNTFGQLGDNSFVSRSSPVPVYGNKTFCQIAAGENHTIAIDKNGKPWGWGDLRWVGINQSTPGCTATPVAVLNSGSFLVSPLVYPYTLSFCKITANGQYSLAIDQYGKAWGWGRNFNFVLGTNSGTVGWAAPYPVYGNKTFCKISTGGQHTLAIDKYGKLWGWGFNSQGQVGIGSPTVCVCTPVAIYGNKTFCQIAAGYEWSHAIDNRGSLWAWGYNRFDIFGDPAINQGYYNTPKSIATSGKTFCKIFAGAYFQNYVIAVDNYGKSWSWGSYFSGFGGKLGNKLLDSCCTPKAVAQDKTFCEINLTSAIDKNGKAWGWGANGYGQIGNNSSVYVTSPVSVYGNKTFCQIAKAVFRGNTLAIDKYGKAWGWGANGYGQLGLGNGDLNGKETPVSVAGNKTFCKVFSFFHQSCGIDKNGKLWGWGYNYNGTLGIGGGGSYEASPLAVCTNQTFCDIVIEGSFELNTKTIALSKHGKIWGWGYFYENDYGFGPGILTSPICMTGSKTFCKISAGGNMNAIDKNGKAWTWGNIIVNVGSDQNGPITFSTTPLAVCTNKTFCEISSYAGSVFAIDNNRKGWAWGSNNFFSLGVGGINPTCKTTPTLIYGNKQFKKITTYNRTAFALDVNGKIWSWGNYLNGLGNAPYPNTPVRVHNF